MISRTGQASVRIERDGTGDGRAYELTFTASNAQGESCTGLATVCVAHDQAHPKCINGGPKFVSTAPEATLR